MKFYIAAPFNQREEVKEIYDRIRNLGHQITTDWTNHKYIKPYNTNQQLSRKYAQEDLEGVLSCDVFVLLSDGESQGRNTELGMAIALHRVFGKPSIYIIGESNLDSMFYFSRGINRKTSLDQVLDELDLL